MRDVQILTCPRKMNAGAWGTLYQTCCHIPDSIPPRDASIEHLGGWWLPEEYFARSLEQDWSVSALSRWVQSGIWLHKPTETLFGGPYGFKWAVLLLTRALWSLNELEEGRPCPHPPPLHDNVAGDIQIVRSDILWLSAELDKSCRRLVQMRKAVPDITQLRVSQPTDLRLAVRHTQPPFMVS